MLVTLTVVVTLKKKSFDSSTVINKHTVTSLISLKIYWPHHDTILKRERVVCEARKYLFKFFRKIFTPFLTMPVWDINEKYGTFWRLKKTVGSWIGYLFVWTEKATTDSYIQNCSMKKFSHYDSSVLSKNLVVFYTDPKPFDSKLFKL